MYIELSLNKRSDIKLAFKCLNEPSVDNLWYFHYLWILHDFMQIPLGHYAVSNSNISVEIKYGGRILHVVLNLGVIVQVIMNPLI